MPAGAARGTDRVLGRGSEWARLDVNREVRVKMALAATPNGRCWLKSRCTHAVSIPASLTCLLLGVRQCRNRGLPSGIGRHGRPLHAVGNERREDVCAGEGYVRRDRLLPKDQLL